MSLVLGIAFASFGSQKSVATYVAREVISGNELVCIAVLRYRPMVTRDKLSCMQAGAKVSGLS
jgi:hypothetical protein